MKLFLAAAAAMTLGGSALAYQLPTIQFDPNVVLQTPATWNADQRMLYQQHISYYPTAWTETERASFRALLGIPPAQWTPEQRALWETHHQSLPAAWTDEQRTTYQQQIASWQTPWLTHQSAASAGMTNDIYSTGTTTSVTTASADRVQEPGNANPERDARGIAVISAAAFIPPGYNGIPSGPAMGGPLEGSEDGYPACSATMTDNCIQLYERGVRESLASWNSTRSYTGVGGPNEGEDEIGDNTPEDDFLDVDIRNDGLDVDGDLDNDGDNDIE